MVGGVYYIFFSGSGTKKVTARFTAAVGVYPGTPVRILGVNVGEVTDVKPTGDYVKVDDGVRQQVQAARQRGGGRGRQLPRQ